MGLNNLTKIEADIISLFGSFHPAVKYSAPIIKNLISLMEKGCSCAVTKGPLQSLLSDAYTLQGALDSFYQKNLQFTFVARDGYESTITVSDIVSIIFFTGKHTTREHAKPILIELYLQDVVAVDSLFEKKHCLMVYDCFTRKGTLYYPESK